jgi:hypothetical protein
MLDHFVMKPRAGRHLVAYQTPGCSVPTVACDCSTAVQAAMERDRLNREQVQREEAIAEERRLCGMRRIVNGAD